MKKYTFLFFVLGVLCGSNPVLSMKRKNPFGYGDSDDRVAKRRKVEKGDPKKNGKKKNGAKRKQVIVTEAVQNNGSKNLTFGELLAQMGIVLVENHFPKDFPFADLIAPLKAIVERDKQKKRG